MKKLFLLFLSLFITITSIAQNNHDKHSLNTKDTKQKLDSVIFVNWDENSNQWLNSYKEELTYNLNWDMIQRISYIWEETIEQWVKSLKYERIYNTNGYLEHDFVLIWNNSTNQWVNFGKSDYLFNSNGTLMQKILNEWDENNSQWNFGWKYEYTYDTNENLMLSIEYNYSQSNNQWINSSKFEYTYDINWNLLQCIRYYWDDTWNEELKFNYSYLNNIFLTEEICAYWVTSTNLWINSWKNDYTYDGNDNLTYKLHFEWDNDINQWSNIWKNEYIYNNSFPYDELILPYYFVDLYYQNHFTEMYFKHMKTYENAFTWDENLNEWIASSIRTYYYSEQNVSGISSTYSPQIEIYPNPAKEFIVVDLNNIANSATINIFDFQGRKVLQQNIMDNEKILVTHLNNGMFIYMINANKNFYRGKLILN